MKCSHVPLWRQPRRPVQGVVAMPQSWQGDRTGLTLPFSATLDAFLLDDHNRIVVRATMGDQQDL